MKKTYKESVLQEHFAHWLEAKGVLFNASMSGVYLGIPAAVRRKKMGAKRGYPDMEILEPRGKFHALFIELKVDSRATPEQKAWQEALNEKGYYAIIMPSGLDFSEAFDWLRNNVEEYLAL